MVGSVSEASELLRRLGASPWLVRHHELVVEVASELLDGLSDHFDLDLDAELVLMGAALHDSGKILHPDEMSEPGHEHEAAGEALLIEHGVSADVARFCKTHGLRSDAKIELEDLLVALADKLWKGKRSQELEEATIELMTTRAGSQPWEAFNVADALFEAIANKGTDRLARSDVPKST